MPKGARRCASNPKREVLDDVANSEARHQEEE